MGFPQARNSYVSSARYAAATQWSAGATVVPGSLRTQLAAPTLGNERVFVCLVGGTTNGTEPTWVITRGGITTETGGVSWQECTGLPAVNGDMDSTPDWNAAKNQAITLGHIIKDVAATHIFIASIAGSAGNGAEPTWNTGAIGATTTDNTVTWTYLGTGFGAWAAAHARLNNALATNWGDSTALPGPNGTNVFPGGQTFYAGDDHAESGASNIDHTSRGSEGIPFYVLCVDHLGSLPPVEADARTTATISTAGHINNNGNCVWDGVSCFTGTSGNLNCGWNGGNMLVKNCTMSCAGSGYFLIGNSSSYKLEFVNISIKFNSSSSAGIYTYGKVIIRDCQNFFATGSALPNILFNTNYANELVVRGCDLSPLSAKNLVGGGTGSAFDAVFENCKMATSYTFYRTSDTPAQIQRVRMVRCGPGTHMYDAKVYDRNGFQQTDLTAARSGGVTIESTPLSWKFINYSTGSVHPGNALSSLQFSKWNATTAADVTATVYGIVNDAALPTNDELWLEVSYPGDSTSPMSSTKSSQRTNFLASAAALTADTSNWTAGTSARIDSYAYVAGNTISLGSNTGRLFFCTTGGTTAASEPGGYATAVDGDSVTDGAAVFRAGCRFKMEVILTSPQPQLSGLLTGVIRIAGTVGTLWPPYYIDPELNLS